MQSSSRRIQYEGEEEIEQIEECDYDTYRSANPCSIPFPIPAKIAEDTQEIKERLMKLVNKGQMEIEAEQEEETKKKWSL